MQGLETLGLTATPDATTGEDARTGVLFALASFVIWGVSPLYFALMNHIPALEVMAHRLIWSLPALVLYAVLTGRMGRVLGAAREGRVLALLLVSASVISVNWFVFVHAIQIGQTVQASFGYYVYPLMAVALGALVLRERVSPMQGAAIALAAAGVAWIAFARGGVPWIALVVATTFAAYGIIRKLSAVGPVVGVFWEVSLASLPLTLWLLWTGGGAFARDWGDALLLVGSSLFTGLPLVMYVEAAKRLEFSTQGVLFYINPTLQLVCAVLLGEAVGWSVLAAFVLIWIGVALYCRDLLRQ